MNIFFLDVDGVLNLIDYLIKLYYETQKPHSGYDYPFDERCLGNLKRLVEETNSKIVITSSWRKETIGKSVLISKLKEYNLDKSIIGYTPILNQLRETEIEYFLDSFDRLPNYIIIDDEKNMGELNEYLIKTNPYKGLTLENVEKGIKKLLKR